MDTVKTKTLGKTVVFVGVVSLMSCTGCANNAAERFLKTGLYRFLSPEKTIAKPDQTQMTWIIESMGELDKTEELYPNATRPRPEDWIYVDEDYVIGPADVLAISIQDLDFEGAEKFLQKEVSASGYIDLPQLKDRIKAEGLTEVQLTKEIENAYSLDKIKDPEISVSVLARRQQAFSVLGAAMRPGTYGMVRQDMRLLEALALVGGVSQPHIEYIYVIRSTPPVRKSEAGEGKADVQPDKLPPASPGARETNPPARNSLDEQLKGIGNLMNPPPTQGKLFQFAEMSDGPAPPEMPQPRSVAVSAPVAKKTFRWVYNPNGVWVKKEITAETSPAPSAPTSRPETRPPLLPEIAPRLKPAIPAPPPTPTPLESPEDPFGWAKVQKTDLVRIIAINLKKLEQGDYRMNIVIRGNDIIRIPELEIGEFYIMGEVFRPGVYSLTGRKLTIKMAMAAAGNLGPLAWPENSVLIRRVGRNQEQQIPLNIENIMRGMDPDIYLKSNDVIAVGTSWQSTLLAVMRNAFRMTYGFGFIYDRNFADNLEGDFRSVYPNSKRFKGW